MFYYWSADFHFSHLNIIKYCKRPFSFEEHDEELIRRWNSRVTNEDFVYFLGDFAWKGPLPFLERLNFQTMVWVLGNHDKINQRSIQLGKKTVRIEPKIEVAKLDYLGQSLEITMCHYAMRKWNKSHFGTWHLYGHSHGTLPPLGLSMDVGVDGHDYYPWSLDEISEFMENRLKTIPKGELGLVERDRA